MGVTIGSNISALRAQRKLGETSSVLSRTFERLSSGQRINRASDDAAGLAISESLKKDVRVYSQAIRNVNDGISALNIAQGALEQLTTISIRQKELAAQAANGTYSLTQRRSMNSEANSLVDEYNRIVSSTEFNGISLFDGSVSELRVQAGYGLDGSVAFQLGDRLARYVGDGTFQEVLSFTLGNSSRDVVSGDFNNDGTADFCATGSSKVWTVLSNGNGTFKAPTSSSAASWGVSGAGDLNGDGNLDIALFQTGTQIASIALGKGDGTFNAPSTFTLDSSWLGGNYLQDMNRDGRLDMVAATQTGINVLIGNGDGTFMARYTFAVGDSLGCAVFDYNGDGHPDIATAAGGSIRVLAGNGDGTLRAAVSYAGSGALRPAAADFNGDGIYDLAAANNSGNYPAVYLGNGNGTFRARLSMYAGARTNDAKAEDFNNDGRPDIMVVGYLDGVHAMLFIGNGDGTFRAGISSQAISSERFTAADFNNDGVLDIGTEEPGDPFRTSLLLANTDRTAEIAYLNITTRSGALEALGTIDATLQRISSELGAIGSTQSRLQVALNTLAVSAENFSAAAGRIMDADVAEESSVLTRTQILQQAGSAVLAQANQQPALALRLLGG